MTSLLCTLDALIDRRMRGNAIHMQQLKCAQPQGDQHLRIELRIWMLQQWPDRRVEVNLPAQHAQYQRSRQVAVRL